MVIITLEQLALQVSKEVLEKSENIHDDLSKLSADFIKKIMRSPKKYFLDINSDIYMIESILDKYELSLELLNNREIKRSVKFPYYSSGINCGECNIIRHNTGLCFHKKKPFEDCSNEELLPYLDSLFLDIPTENHGKYLLTRATTNFYDPNQGLYD